MGDVVNALPNYTGPYISNGKIQASVEFGDKLPKDQLDALSRLHDSAYVRYTDRGHLEAADIIYREESQKLVAKFPELAGNLVVYYNFAERTLANYVSVTTAISLFKGITMTIPTLLSGAITNMFQLNDTLVNGAQYKKDVYAYYKTDPLGNDKNYENHGPLPSAKDTAENAETNKKVAEALQKKLAEQAAAMAGWVDKPLPVTEWKSTDVPIPPTPTPTPKPTMYPPVEERYVQKQTFDVQQDSSFISRNVLHTLWRGKASRYRRKRHYQPRGFFS